MEVKQIAIYGAGGFAREVAWLIQICNQNGEKCEVACFIDDNPGTHGKVLNDISVFGLEAARRKFPHAYLVGGVGIPKTREMLMDKAAAVGFRFETIIHPRVERSKWINIGIGTIVCAGNILTTNITLGQHVQINLDCTIGHDVIMDDFTTLAPGVHISGWVHIGKRVYIGTGGVIINGTEENPIIIGDDAVIGAGAVVINDIPAGNVAVGVPAKVIREIGKRNK